MKAKTGIAARLVQFNTDIGQMRTLRQLIRYIPDRGLEKTAFILLIFWILTPLLVMVRSLFLERGNDAFAQMLNQSLNALVWLTVLQITGLLGLGLGLVALAKSIDRAQSGHIGLKIYLRTHIMLILLFLMLFWSFLSSLASDDFLLSFVGTSYRQEGLAVYIFYAGLFICAYQIRNSRLVIWLLNIFTGIASFISLLVLLNINLFNTWFDMEARRAIFFNANHFAYYLCLALMSTLYLAVRQENVYRRLGHLASLILITAALVQNQSLGPYLAVIFGFGLYFILILKSARHLLRRLALSATLFLGTTVVVNLITPSLLADLVRLWLDSKNIMAGADDARFAGSNRWQLWTAGLRFVARRPLFGFGPDNLGAQYEAIGLAYDRPHNELIQFAASLGIPALLFYLAALTSHLVDMLQKKWLATLTGIGFICILAAYLFSSLLGNTMFYTTPYFLIILGMSSSLLAHDHPEYKSS